MLGKNDGQRRQLLRQRLADPTLKIYTHHGKYDEHVLIRHGFHPGPIAFDSMVAATGHREPGFMRQNQFNFNVQPNNPRSQFLNRFASNERTTEANTTILQALMLMNGIVNLATTIPSAPGYIGTFDAPGIAVLTAYGVPLSTAAGYTLVLHVALWLPITLLGIYLLAQEGIKWSESLRTETKTV